jgi:hypothetical protein
MLAAGALLGASRPAGPHVLVICSPGSPGTTLQAQPTLDAFAAAMQSAAGWPAGSLAAVYFEQAEPGRERLARADASLALVSSSFFFEFSKTLSLQPLLEAVPESGPGEVYSLVAKKGKVASPASLTGWEIMGGPAFSSGFVRRVLLGDWGEVPRDTRIIFSARPLTALRRAASGEPVAVVLDREQAAAVTTLPFGADLEVVHRSESLPSGLLCLVSSRLPKARVDTLVKALIEMDRSEAGKATLKSLRLSGFRQVNSASLRALEAAPKTYSGSSP